MQHGIEVKHVTKNIEVSKMMEDLRKLRIVKDILLIITTAIWTAVAASLVMILLLKM